MVFLWAALEAIVWFVIPEFLLLLVIFMKVERKFDLVRYDILGTVAGTIVAWWLRFGDDQLLKVPYIYQPMIDQVRTWYDAHGILGLAFQPFSGVPYKVFTHIAPEYGFPLLLFIVVALAARMVRYLVIYQAAKAAYPAIHPIVRRHYAVLFVLAIIIFTGLLMRVSSLYGPMP